VVVIGGSIGISQWRQHLEQEQKALEQKLRNELRAQELAKEAREARSEGYAGAPEAAAKMEEAVKLDPDNWRLRKKLVGYYGDMMGHFDVDRKKIDKQLLAAIDTEGAPRLELLRLLEKSGSPAGQKKAKEILKEEFPYSAPIMVEEIGQVTRFYAKAPQKGREKVEEIKQILDENTITNLPYKWYRNEEAIRYKLLMRDYHGEREFGNVQRAVEKWEKVIQYKRNHPDKYLNLVSGEQWFSNSTSDLVKRLYEKGYYEQAVSICDRSISKPKDVSPANPNYKICAFSLVKMDQESKALELVNKRRLFYERSLKSQLDRIEYAESGQSEFYEQYPHKRREHKEGLKNTREQIEKFENLIEQVKKGDLE
jgi:hypothetical protein